MSDRRLDDELFRAVSAARPAPRGDGDSPFSPDAQAVVERVLTTKRAPTRRARRAIVRWSGHAIPALASVGALALAALALLVLVPRHPQVANPTAGPYHRLTATQYEFALDFADYDLPNAALLFRAEQVLRARCMQARGFRYVMDPAGSRSGSNTSPSLPFAEGSPSTFYPSPILGGYPRATLLAYVSAYGFGIYDDAIARPVRAASEQYQMRSALLC